VTSCKQMQQLKCSKFNLGGEQDKFTKCYLRSERLTEKKSERAQRECAAKTQRTRSSKHKIQVGFSVPSVRSGSDPNSVFSVSCGKNPIFSVPSSSSATSLLTGGGFGRTFGRPMVRQKRAAGRQNEGQFPQYSAFGSGT
jgi:hypothetical protein